MRRLPKGETAMSTLSMLTFRASIFAAVFTLAPLSPLSHAQDNGMVARVKVPFGFQTASQHFAPGDYTLGMENDHTLVIRGASQSRMAMTSVEDNAQPVKTGKAVLHRYGGQYFLSEITIAGKSRHLHLTPSRTESQLRNGQKKTAPAGVELSLLQGSR
jgi:hypothetical protein